MIGVGVVFQDIKLITNTYNHELFVSTATVDLDLSYNKNRDTYFSKECITYFQLL